MSNLLYKLLQGQALLKRLNQPHPGTDQGNPGNTTQADRMQRIAEPAEMVEQQRGKHLPGKDRRDHGGCAKLGHQDDGCGDKERPERTAGPDPPGVATDRGHRRQRNAGCQRIDDQGRGADGKGDGCGNHRRLGPEPELCVDAGLGRHRDAGHQGHEDEEGHG